MYGWIDYYRQADRLYFGSKLGVKLRHPIPDFDTQRERFYAQNRSLSGGALLAAANSLRRLAPIMEHYATYPKGEEWFHLNFID